jgi:hypothetical protein
MKKTWYKDSKSGTWEEEFELDGQTYWVETDYGIDYTIDDGDEVTPPSTTIRNIELINPVFYRYDEDLDTYEGNEIDADEDIIKELALKVEERIVEREYERL